MRMPTNIAEQLSKLPKVCQKSSVANVHYVSCWIAPIKGAFSLCASTRVNARCVVRTRL